MSFFDKVKSGDSGSVMGKPYPYKEYSYPWFNKKYFTLKGSSTFTLNDIKRVSFRNFYQPNTRYIFSGGRLCF